MKKMLPLFLAAALAVASCSKSDDAPGAAALLGTWVVQSETKVSTPKNGGAATTTTVQKPLPSGLTSITFRADGTYTLVDPSRTYSDSGTYTYANNILTLPYYSTSGVQSAKILAVPELTATRLVTVLSTEDASYKYTTTDLYTR
ncbi:lipocalin family protein [Hymenobacter artigasi]|uniref:Lipocalin-like domain-containing protein n=1 Tax=Hymenobacter artigasi TaxID=2719616 RepID=A0ABX1HRQ3_9BACT|nr:lipocalin family protein [Hymenobacter artigasi]NKI92033.1 hypothetical protein [Hymenobacter artigasi]